MKKRTIFANEVLLYAWIACHVLFFIGWVCMVAL